MGFQKVGSKLQFIILIVTDMSYFVDVTICFGKGPRTMATADDGIQCRLRSECLLQVQASLVQQ